MTVIAGSKIDALNQNYKNVETFQLQALSNTEINDRLNNDSNGTLYHETSNQLFVKVGGALELIETT